jgi:hypothetical protein
MINAYVQQIINYQSKTQHACQYAHLRTGMIALMATALHQISVNVFRAIDFWIVATVRAYRFVIHHVLMAIVRPMDANAVKTFIIYPIMNA